MAPETQAPTEYLKQPSFCATTETGFLAPPMIASGASNGDAGPKSMTNPVFLLEDCHVTVVLVVTQKNAFPLAPAILGVAEAPLPAAFFTSTVHGVEADTQVLPALDRKSTRLNSSHL